MEQGQEGFGIPSEVASQGYSFEKLYGDGGKSVTALVEKNGTKALLKLPTVPTLLREQKFRFRKEAEALEMLEGHGAPTVYGYDFEGDEPYILMEYIEGGTLTQLVSGKGLGTDQSLDLLYKILAIVGRIHELGLLHRDIKPDNVMVRLNGEVCLIDYGLCRTFPEVDEDTFKTPAGIELGNRFLRLPEFNKGEKFPSSASDVTFCIGLLFYMLSGKSPNQLRDENSMPPHRRKILSDDLENTKWLTYVFDKGFAHELSLRFQDASDVQSFIESMRNMDELDENDNVAEEFSRFVASEDFQRRDRIRQMLLQAHRRFIGAAGATFNSDLATAGSGPNASSDGYTIMTDFVAHRNGESTPLSQYGITSVLSQDLAQVSYFCTVNNTKTTEGIHSVCEESRIADDYSKMGGDCGRMAIRNLIVLLKAH